MYISSEREERRQSKFVASPFASLGIAGQLMNTFEATVVFGAIKKDNYISFCCFLLVFVGFCFFVFF